MEIKKVSDWYIQNVPRQIMPAAGWRAVMVWFDDSRGEILVDDVPVVGWALVEKRSRKDSDEDYRDPDPEYAVELLIWSDDCAYTVDEAAIANGIYYAVPPGGDIPTDRLKDELNAKIGRNARKLADQLK